VSLAIQTILVSYVAQAASAAVVGLLLVYFFTRYRKPYLLHWVASAFAMGVFYLAVAGDLFLGEQRGTLEPVRIASALSAGIAVAWAVIFFISGTFMLARQRPIALRRFRLLVSVAGAAGLLFVLPLALLQTGTVRQMLFVGGGSLVLGLGLGAGAALLWRGRPQSSFMFFIASLAALATVKLLCAALFFGHWRGVVAQPYPPALAMVEMLAFFIVGLAMIISLLEDENEASSLAVAEVERMAYHDGLTGLPNRALLLDSLRGLLFRAQEKNEKFALYFLDLDRFKGINDSLGPSTGDALLRQAAERIRRTLRDHDLAARFGGDEFVCIHFDLKGTDEAVDVGQRLLDALREPFHLAGREITVTTSIGVAIFPVDGYEADELVRNADSAMYRAKARGGNRCFVFEPQMLSLSLERLELETALRRGLREDRFVVHYQPLFDIHTGRIYGLEALVRWNHPERGLLHPNYFIPVAESSGIIIELGGWVLREACMQVQSWREERGIDLVISVNFSARQLHEPGIVEQVAAVLQESGLPARLLEIEITESVAVGDFDRTVEILNQLRALGVRIAIDDFGTGYSSLAYLRMLPVDTVKLDRSFVREIAGPSDGAIARGVISMAHGLNLKVLAEGVETAEEFAFLKANKCDNLQGFFYSVPLSAGAFETFVEDNSSLFATTPKAETN
jgi:diguanylate cyclase (GGDEF)-like protein